MNKQELISKLNEDLSSEYPSIIQNICAVKGATVPPGAPPAPPGTPRPQPVKQPPGKGRPAPNPVPID
jgi:hypothetical protein